ncbi:uncharacterized protein [Panulirus ornatus]|uniref:uncharacterized protein n=1 Tax=Panulirus ornatus TaxID=150431 RepID=UPI003A892632
MSVDMCDVRKPLESRVGMSLRVFDMREPDDIAQDSPCDVFDVQESMDVHENSFIDVCGVQDSDSVVKDSPGHVYETPEPEDLGWGEVPSSGTSASIDYPQYAYPEPQTEPLDLSIRGGAWTAERPHSPARRDLEVEVNVDDRSQDDRAGMNTQAYDVSYNFPFQPSHHSDEQLAVLPETQEDEKPSSGCEPAYSWIPRPESHSQEACVPSPPRYTWDPRVQLYSTAHSSVANGTVDTLSGLLGQVAEENGHLGPNYNWHSPEYANNERPTYHDSIYGRVSPPEPTSSHGHAHWFSRALPPEFRPLPLMIPAAGGEPLVWLDRTSARETYQEHLYSTAMARNHPHTGVMLPRFPGTWNIVPQHPASVHAFPVHLHSSGVGLEDPVLGNFLPNLAHMNRQPIPLVSPTEYVHPETPSASTSSKSATSACNYQSPVLSHSVERMIADEDDVKEPILGPSSGQSCSGETSAFTKVNPSTAAAQDELELPSSSSDDPPTDSKKVEPETESLNDDDNIESSVVPGVRSAPNGEDSKRRETAKSPEDGPEASTGVLGKDSDVTGSSNQIKSSGSKDFPRLFECGICQLRLCSYRGLEKHLRHHEDSLTTQVAVCVICRLALPNAFKLHVHLRIHNDEPSDRRRRDLRCSEGRRVCPECGRSFAKLQGLSEHMKVHKGKGIFKCDHCPRTFRSWAGYIAHIKRCHQGKLKCFQCSSEFADLLQYKAHDCHLDDPMD